MLVAFLDDTVIQSTSEYQACEDLRITLQVLQDHGLSININKSHLTPTNQLLYLGAKIDITVGKVHLSQEWQGSIRELVSWIMQDRRVPLSTLSQLLGKMVSCISIVPWTRLHTRALQ